MFLELSFPRRKLFTRHNKSSTNMSRIDQLYAPNNMISDALGYTFDPCSDFDHDLVSVKLIVNRPSTADLVFGNLILV